MFNDLFLFVTKMVKQMNHKHGKTHKRWREIWYIYIYIWYTIKIRNLDQVIYENINKHLCVWWWWRWRGKTWSALRVDPRDDVIKLSLNLLELEILRVQPLMDTSHGNLSLSCRWVGGSRCFMCNSWWTRTTTTRASPRSIIGYRYSYHNWILISSNII